MTEVTTHDEVSAHPEITHISDALSFKIARLDAINARAGSYLFKQHHGITLSHWRILGLVAAMGPVRSRKVREQLWMDKGQFSRVVKQLVDRGLIEATPLASNASALALDVTHAGRELHKTLIDFTAQRNARTAGTLSREECETLLRLLDKVTDHADELLRQREAKA